MRSAFVGHSKIETSCKPPSSTTSLTFLSSSATEGKTEGVHEIVGERYHRENSWNNRMHLTGSYECMPSTSCLRVAGLFCLHGLYSPNLLKRFLFRSDIVGFSSHPLGVTFVCSPLMSISFLHFNFSSDTPLIRTNSLCSSMHQAAGQAEDRYEQGRDERKEADMKGIQIPKPSPSFSALSAAATTPPTRASDGVELGTEDQRSIGMERVGIV